MELEIQESHPGIWIIDNLLSTEYCNDIINLVDGLEFKKAHQYEKGRKNFEVDFENNILYDDLLDAIKPYKFIFGKSVFSIHKFFSTFAAFKYLKGNFITPLADAPVDIANEKTSITFLIYLNDDFSGGETFFNNQGVSILPATGRALFFLQEKVMMHEAKPILEGVKYILRLDSYIENHS